MGKLLFNSHTSGVCNEFQIHSVSGNPYKKILTFIETQGQIVKALFLIIPCYKSSI